MASSPKLISIIFLFAFFSMQIHAREFFSKMPSVNNNEKEITTTIPEATQKTYSLPNREEQSFKKQEQEPRFIPETQNGYGLYGHESGQLPSSTTTTKETYEPYVTPVRYHPDEPYNGIPESSINNNNKNTYYNKNSFESSEQQNLGEAMNNYYSNHPHQNNNNNKNTYYNKNSFESSDWQLADDVKFTEKGWSNKENQNNNNNYYYYNGNGYKYNNGEKQGMSDTRYLENGRYYHDVKSENNYYPNQFENSRGVASRNEFNENRYNNMGRYSQNQEEFEETEEEIDP